MFQVENNWLLMRYFFLINALKIGIFDGGSTGTRLNLFEFDNKMLRSQLSIKSDKMKTSKVKKGLHQLSDQDIENTVQYLIKESHVTSKTPLGFFGTGGLRAINIDKQKKVIDIVGKTLKNYNLIQSRIIDGVEEALYSFKAFEYINPQEKDYVIIDMGGKSVQIIHKDKNDIKLLSLELGIMHYDCLSNVDDPLSKILSSANENNSKLNLNYFIPTNAISYLTCNDKLEKTFLKFHCSETELSENTGIVLLKKNFNSIDEITDTNYIPEYLNLNVNSHLSFKKDTQSINPKLECIKKFLNKKLKISLTPVKTIFLMSFFEEIVKFKTQFTLKQLIEDYDGICNSDILTTKCLKFFYVLQFLSKLGINPNANLKLANNTDNVDISWPLGMAISLKESDNIQEMQ